MTKNNIERFIVAQERDFEIALQEINSGKKQSHWMWYIFPQLRGLGHSYMADYYGIASIEEAIEYWNNDYLRNNLLQIMNVLLKLNLDNATTIFGTPDDLKLRSCTTLFLHITKEKIFRNVLDKFFKGLEDQETINLIEKKNRVLDLKFANIAELCEN